MKSKPKSKFAQGARKFFRMIGVVSITTLIRLVFMPRIVFESKQAKQALKKHESILISNHCFWFDPLMMYLIGPWGKLSVVTAKEVLEGFKGKLLDVLGCVSLDRDTMDLVCLRECCNRIRQGETVAIFPEGQINFSGELLPFKAGVSFIAAQTGAPVVPVFISGDYRPFGKVKILVGDAINLKEDFSTPVTAIELENATQRLYNDMATLQHKLHSTMTEKEIEGVKNFRAKFASSREVQISQKAEEEASAVE